MGMGIRVWRIKNKRKKKEEKETCGSYGCKERKEKE